MHSQRHNRRPLIDHPDHPTGAGSPWELRDWIGCIGALIIVAAIGVGTAWLMGQL